MFDTDEMWMHEAHLFNYLGFRSMDGDVFMDRAREQVTTDHGVGLNQGEAVSTVEKRDGRFAVSAGDGAAAALNILTEEKGEHFHDFDVPGDVAEQ